MKFQTHQCDKTVTKGGAKPKQPKRYYLTAKKETGSKSIWYVGFRDEHGAIGSALSTYETDRDKAEQWAAELHARPGFSRSRDGPRPGGSRKLFVEKLADWYTRETEINHGRKVLVSDPCQRYCSVESHCSTAPAYYRGKARLPSPATAYTKPGRPILTASRDPGGHLDTLQRHWWRSFASY